MSKKKGHIGFVVGKGVRGDVHVPMQGPPNTNMDRYRKNNGKFFSRRKFGPDGYAIKDYDVADAHKQQDHVHDIRGKRIVTDRAPSKKERREINKAKKKRRFPK